MCRDGQPASLRHLICDVHTEILSLNFNEDSHLCIVMLYISFVYY
jgi:hypothetical protein